MKRLPNQIFVHFVPGCSLGSILTSKLVTLLKMGFQSSYILRVRLLIAAVQWDIEGKINRQPRLSPKLELIWREPGRLVFGAIICMH